MMQNGENDLYLTNIQGNYQKKTNQTSKSNKNNQINHQDQNQHLHLHDPNVHKGIFQGEKTTI